MLQHRASFSKILEEFQGADTPTSPTAAQVPCVEYEASVMLHDGLSMAHQDVNLFLSNFEDKEKLGSSQVPLTPSSQVPAQCPAPAQQHQVTAVLRPGALPDDTADAAVEPGGLEQELEECISRSASPMSPVRSPVGRPATRGLGVALPPHGAASAAGKSARRPRRQLPNSPAVLAAMPRPPRRQRNDAAMKAATAGMGPEKARLEKNRRSAKECRLRKKEYVTNLEAKVVEFEQRELVRVQELAEVQETLAGLQHRYAELLKASATSHGIATLE